MSTSLHDDLNIVISAAGEHAPDSVELANALSSSTRFSTYLEEQQHILDEIEELKQLYKDAIADYLLGTQIGDDE